VSARAALPSRGVAVPARHVVGEAALVDPNPEVPGRFLPAKPFAFFDDHHLAAEIERVGHFSAINLLCFNYMSTCRVFREMALVF